MPEPVPSVDRAADHTFVFISGLHRSGTTQLHSTLGTHPDVSGMVGTGAPHDEGQHLRWEDLCADTGARLAGIAEFVGIDQRFEPPDLDPRVDEKYVAQWADMTVRSRDDAALRSVLAENVDLAARFGYDITDLHALGEMAI